MLKRLLMCTAVLAGPAGAAGLDLDTSAGALAANRKVQCSMIDGKPVTYWWHSDMYSRVPGERDRLLFKVEGMNVRRCVTVTDTQKGTGFRLVSRELLFYRDPATGELVRRWKNPWTEEEVDVIQVANDPVNSTWCPVGRDGEPFRWSGSQQGSMWWQTTTVPLFYKNPLAGDYQDYVGGAYHATETFNFFGDVADLLDPKSDTAKTRVGWVRISGFLPWMKMGGRVGDLYFHTAGRKLDRWEDMPDNTRRLIEAEYPAWREPPPGNDERPNETSWTYFKKRVAAPASGGNH